MANHRILIVDYEPRSIKALRKPLEEAGYEIAVAKDGLTGIEAFHSLKPDLALIEAMLPKKNGFDVCQELKKTPHGLDTPIVIASSVYKGRKYRTQALHHYGCNEYIEKPIEGEKLLELVRGLLRDRAPAAAPVGPAGGGTDSAPKDETETEITDRLDELLGGGNPKQASAGGPRSGPRDRVLSFDPARSRSPRAERSSYGSRTSTAVQAHATAPALHDPRPILAAPAVAPRRAAGPDAARRTKPLDGASGRNPRVWIIVGLFIALTVLLLLATGKL